MDPLHCDPGRRRSRSRGRSDRAGDVEGVMTYQRRNLVHDRWGHSLAELGRAAATFNHLEDQLRDSNREAVRLRRG